MNELLVSQIKTLKQILLSTIAGNFALRRLRQDA